jgi:hypothetical protein
MVDFGSAIKKPFMNSKTLAIGAVIGLIPIVSLLINGYGLKIAEKTIKGKKDLIEWSFDSLSDYVIKAIMSIIIMLGYLIIPLIIIGAGIMTLMSGFIGQLASGTVDYSSMINMSMSAGPIVAIGGILMLAAIFVIPMAMMKWLKKGNVGAAFNIMNVVKNALTTDYIIAWLFIIVYGIVVGFIVGIISAILLLIPVLGWILLLVLNGALSFIMTVTMMSVFAQTVK